MRKMTFISEYRIPLLDQFYHEKNPLKFKGKEYANAN